MNNSQDNKNITRFFSDVDQKIQQLDNEIKNGHEPFILLLSLIDTLSFYAFPKETDNRKRFIKLIDNYSNWGDKDRISLIQLQCLFKKIIIPSSKKHDELSKEVETRISKWTNWEIYCSSEVDPLLSDFNQYKDGLTDHLINAARYSSLLWVMRNWLVHTLSKPPGCGPNIINDKSTPYYIGTIGTKSWTLVIPPQVILSIIKECSKNLQKYFEEKSINPYKQVIFTECWFSDREIKSLANKVKRRSCLSKIVWQIKKCFSSTK
ncbi:MAG: hypothetical protein V1709_07670 [Planctomycetota bacterium]